MANLRDRLAIVALLLALVGCARDRPVYNVTNHPLPAQAQAWPLARIERVIAFAGQDRGWQIEPVQPGMMRGRLDVRGHKAEVNILATRQSFSIVLVSSERLAQNGSVISNKYNQWVRNLEQDIDRRMIQTALGRELKPENKPQDDSD